MKTVYPLQTKFAGGIITTGASLKILVFIAYANSEGSGDPSHFCLLKAQAIRTSDGGNGNHSVSLPIILIKIQVNQMLPSSYISLLLAFIL